MFSFSSLTSPLVGFVSFLLSVLLCLLSICPCHVALMELAYTFWPNAKNIVGRSARPSGSDTEKLTTLQVCITFIKGTCEFVTGIFIVSINGNGM